MSVIIRLQGLSWSASAMDIRNFFKGLSIPPGGVHIIGGENGDAFIAFTTDEDARQAMMMTNKILNETTVQLFLSSKTEMQSTISKAKEVNAPLVPGAQTTPPQQGAGQSTQNLFGVQGLSSLQLQQIAQHIGLTQGDFNKQTPQSVQQQPQREVEKPLPGEYAVGGLQDNTFNQNSGPSITQPSAQSFLPQNPQGQMFQPPQQFQPIVSENVSNNSVSAAWPDRTPPISVPSSILQNVSNLLQGDVGKHLSMIQSTLQLQPPKVEEKNEIVNRNEIASFPHVPPASKPPEPMIFDYQNRPRYLGAEPPRSIGGPLMFPNQERHSDLQAPPRLPFQSQPAGPFANLPPPNQRLPPLDNIRPQLSESGHRASAPVLNQRFPPPSSFINTRPPFPDPGNANQRFPPPQNFTDRPPLFETRNQGTMHPTIQQFPERENYNNVRPTLPESSIAGNLPNPNQRFPPPDSFNVRPSLLGPGPVSREDFNLSSTFSQSPQDEDKPVQADNYNDKHPGLDKMDVSVNDSTSNDNLDNQKTDLSSSKGFEKRNDSRDSRSERDRDRDRDKSRDSDRDRSKYRDSQRYDRRDRDRSRGTDRDDDRRRRDRDRDSRRDRDRQTDRDRRDKRDDRHSRERGRDTDKKSNSPASSRRSSKKRSLSPDSKVKNEKDKKVPPHKADSTSDKKVTVSSSASTVTTSTAPGSPLSRSIALTLQQLEAVEKVETPVEKGSSEPFNTVDIGKSKTQTTPVDEEKADKKRERTRKSRFDTSDDTKDSMKIDVNKYESQSGLMNMSAPGPWNPNPTKLPLLAIPQTGPLSNQKPCVLLKADHSGFRGPEGHGVFGGSRDNSMFRGPEEHSDNLDLSEHGSRMTVGKHDLRGLENRSEIREGNFRGREDHPGFRGSGERHDLRGSSDHSDFRGSNDRHDFRGPNHPELRGPIDGPDFRGSNDRPDMRGSERPDFGGPSDHQDSRGPNYRPDFRGPKDGVDIRAPNDQQDFRGATDRPGFKGSSDRHFRGPNDQEFREPNDLHDFRGLSNPDFRGPNDRPDFRGPNDRRDFRGPNDHRDFRGPNERPDFRGPNDRPDFKGPREGPDVRGPREGPDFRDPREGPEFRGPRGPREGPDFRGPREGPDFRGPREGPDFRGPREGSDFRGSREGPDFRRSKDGPDFRHPKDGPDFRGPNDHPNFRGPNERPEFRGSRDGPDFRGPTDRTDFRGPNDRPNFRGPNERPDFRGPKDGSDFRRSQDGPDFKGSNDRPDFRSHNNQPNFRGPREGSDFRAPSDHNESRHPGDYKGTNEHSDFRGPIDQPNFRSSGNGPGLNDRNDSRQKRPPTSERSGPPPMFGGPPMENRNQNNPLPGRKPGLLEHPPRFEFQGSQGRGATNFYAPKHDSVRPPMNIDRGQGTCPTTITDDVKMRPSRGPNNDPGKKQSKLPESENIDSKVQNDINNCAVSIENLPLETNYKDVRKLFDGKDIPRDGIKIINDSKGNRTGNVYVKFVHSDLQKKAILLDETKYKNNLLVVRPVTLQEYEEAVDSFCPDDSDDEDGKSKRDLCNTLGATLRALKGEEEQKKQSVNKSASEDKEKAVPVKKPTPVKEESPRDYIIRVGKLPMNTSEYQVREFFKSCKVSKDSNGIVFHKGQNGVRTGVCFVEFVDSDSFKKGLNHKARFRNEPITISPVSKRERNDLITQQPSNTTQQPSNTTQQPSITSKKTAETVTEKAKPPLFCIRISNIPKDFIVSNVKHLLTGMDIVTRGITICHDAIGRPIGECFVEFTSGKEVEKAMAKDGLQIGPGKISVQAVTKEKMIEGLRDLRLALQPEKPTQQAVFYFVKATNLPKGISTGELINFFSGYGAAPESIRLNVGDTSDLKDSSTALIGFKQKEDAERAVTEKQGDQARGRPVNLAKVILGV